VLVGLHDTLDRRHTRHTSHVTLDTRHTRHTTALVLTTINKGTNNMCTLNHRKPTHRSWPSNTNIELQNPGIAAFCDFSPGNRLDPFSQRQSLAWDIARADGHCGLWERY